MGLSASLISKDIIQNLSEKCSGVQLFLQDEDAKACFNHFYDTGKWKNIALNKNNEDNETNDNIALYEDYILPSNIKEKLMLKINQSENSCADADSSTLLESEREKMDLLLLLIFPIFLKSSEYEIYVERKSSMQSPPILLPESRLCDETTREERLDKLFSAQQISLCDIINDAMASVDSKEIDSILSLNTDFGQLLAMIENLDMCVSIATARPNRHGFPLIYVNKAFEQTTGYSRQEIIGQNCKFLQSEWSEKDQIDRMVSALKTAQPIKVVITNTRKDGSEFFNLLSMKPVFNDKGVYSFVIGVQYDLALTDTFIQHIKLVDDLLSILPNILS